MSAAGWWQTARGVLTEAGWLVAHTWRYPWAMGHEHIRAEGAYRHHRTDGLALEERGLVVSDIGASSTPVLLVHGIGDNRSVFAPLARGLRRRGHGVVHAVNFSLLTPVTGDIRAAARELGHHVERLRIRTGSDSVQIVGHSLGGMIARYYVQRLGGVAAVEALVTVGTAHAGSALANVLPGTTVLRQMRPGSDLVAELALPAPSCRTRFLAVWSHFDPLIVPRESGRIDHPDLAADDLEIDDLAHLSMVLDPRTAHRIALWLAWPDDTTTSPTPWENTS